MISIFIVRLAERDTIEYASAIDSLPFGESERERLSRIKNEHRRRESLGGLEALRAACEHKALSLPLCIERADTGKPHFTHPSAPHFSISHTGNFAAAVLSDSEIGLDIEAIDVSREVLHIASRYFTNDEQAELSHAADVNERFYELWTAKEARAKLDGRGLGALLSGDAPCDVHVVTRVIKAGGERLCISVCAKAEDEVEIYVDGKRAEV